MPCFKKMVSSLLTLLPLLAMILGIGLYAWQQHAINSARLLTASPTHTVQLNWQQATEQCGEQGRLPTLTELLGFYYLDQSAFVPETDYWSSSTLVGYAFGLNTNLGWLSFDRLDDEDHVLCVTGTHY